MIDPRPFRRLVSGPVAAIVIGVLAFVAVAGINIVEPSNIAWLNFGDFATQYLGWQFFRISPWSFPPGASPNYGIELASSVVYSDSIPGLALLFKSLAPVLPHHFQYFGLWLLACFVLQAFIAWKLVGLISQSALVRVPGCVLFVFAPPFLLRATMHLALAAHWLLLASLYLALRPSMRYRTLSWAMVLFMASVIHAYLLVMAAAIWFADYLGRLLEAGTWRGAFREPALVLAPAAAATWLCGYFVLTPDAGAAPLGEYGMNLLSVFDANGWSYVLKNIPKPRSTSEGLNYLGLGAILLVVFLLPLMQTIRIPNVPSRWLPLLVIAALLTLFAISNHVALGPLMVIEAPLPRPINEALSTFQSSGRFFWPVFYALLLLIVWLVVKSFPAHVAGALMFLSAYAQVLDTSAGWLPRRDEMQAKGEYWQTGLNSPFWEAAAKRYTKLRWLPPENHSEHWRELAYFASQHAMPTDAVYLARMESRRLEDARARVAESVRGWKFDEKSVYVLDERHARAAAWEIPPGGDVLGRVDGLAVLAPSWRSCTDCPAIDEIRLSSLLPTPQLGEELTFEAHGEGERYLALGWSQPTREGVWTGARRSSLVLPLPVGVRGDTKIEFKAWTYIGVGDGDLTIRCYVNRRYLRDVSITRKHMLSRFVLDIPADVVRLSHDGVALVEMEIVPGPALNGVPSKVRGFRLIEARFSEASPDAQRPQTKL